MTAINRIKCDGPEYQKEVDLLRYGSPQFHCLILGGSDFEMSFGEQRFDFCSEDCLIQFLVQRRCMEGGQK